MKLNFWQILGVVLILVGIAVIAYRKMGGTPAQPPTLSLPEPTTQP